MSVWKCPRGATYVPLWGHADGGRMMAQRDGNVIRSYQLCVCRASRTYPTYDRKTGWSQAPGFPTWKHWTRAQLWRSRQKKKRKSFLLLLTRHKYNTQSPSALMKKTFTVVFHFLVSSVVDRQRIKSRRGYEWRWRRWWVPAWRNAAPWPFEKIKSAFPWTSKYDVTFLIISGNF